MKILAGVDEVGRGSLIGPVYAAAVILNNSIDKKLLKDSKTLTKDKREELEKYIKKNLTNSKYVILRLGTIYGPSPGIRFHTAVNKFCYNASIGEPITVYKTALNQFRPYLSLKDAFKVFKFTIDKDLFKNNIYKLINYERYSLVWVRSQN